MLVLLTLGRAENELAYQNSKWEGLDIELRTNIWQGARDPAAVASECAWSTRPFFGISTKQMRDFSDAGHALNTEGERLLDNLPRVNRRCNETNPEHDPAFCGRSEVRREVWGDFKSALLVHRDESSRMRNAVQPDRCPALAGLTKWDSIRAWCRGMNHFGLRECE